jgi:tripartite-type tricarboxylate transporter receptor subunit TctC
VSSALGVNSVAELKKLAQAKPDSLNYATLGEGSFPDLFLKWVNNQWGTKIVGVPYKGGGPAAQALAANQVQMTRFGIGNFLGLIQAGNVKALAVSADKRSPLLPDVPTVAETVPGYELSVWYGAFGPAGMPPALVTRLNQEINRIMSLPEVKAQMNAIGVETATSTPQQFATILRRDADRYGKLIRELGIKGE